MDISIEPLGSVAAHRPTRTETTSQQDKYIQLKLTTNLNNVQMAKQLDVHYNTITNWNKSPVVQMALTEQVELVRKDNQVSMQRLMAVLIRESTDMLNNDEIGSSIKIQLIGQLFSQAGKFAGLEPSKQVEKKVTVVKTLEQMINCEAVDVESE